MTDNRPELIWEALMELARLVLLDRPAADSMEWERIVRRYRMTAEDTPPEARS